MMRWVSLLALKLVEGFGGLRPSKKIIWRGQPLQTSPNVDRKGDYAKTI